MEEFHQRVDCSPVQTRWGGKRFAFTLHRTGMFVSFSVLQSVQRVDFLPDAPKHVIVV